MEKINIHHVITPDMIKRWAMPGHTKVNTKLDIKVAYEYERDSRVAAWMATHGRNMKHIAQHLSLSVPLVATMLYRKDVTCPTNN